MNKMIIAIIFGAIATVGPTFAKKDLPKVQLEMVKKTILEKKLYFPVQITSQVDSQVLADDNLIVIKKLVKLGDTVKKGAPLLALRNRDMSVHYERRILRAPVSGTIASINVNQGQYVTKGQPLIHINDPKRLVGKIEVSAIDYNKLKPNLEGSISISSLKLKDIPVKVSAIGAAVDPLTGTISAELEILDQKEALVPGVIGKAQITLNKEEIILVKEKSLYYIGDDILIATLAGDTVKKKKVTLGQRHKDKIEVLTGLDVGDEFIAESPKFLADGKKVEVMDKKRKKKTEKK